jgi:hypothetical protein
MGWAGQVQFLAWQEFFFSIVSRPILTITKWILEAISLEVRRLGHETDHSSSSSAKIKKGGAVLPFSHMSK